jgi:hypothetical protein
MLPASACTPAGAMTSPIAFHRIEALGITVPRGRAGCWIKVKNPAAPAVRREAEEEWNS